MAPTRTTLPVDDPAVGEVTAAVDEPARGGSGPAVLLAPGAGGDLDGAGLVALAEVLRELGCLVVRCNLPHNEVGRPASRAERTVAVFEHLSATARERFAADRAWIVGGKSYGGRVASMAVAAGTATAGLLFYGYPLHPPGKPDRPRVDHWPRIAVPALFLQGTHDPFCDLVILRANLRLLAAPATLEIVEGGDHSLDIPAKNSADGARHPAEEVLRRMRDAIAVWVGSLLGGD